MQSLVLRSQRYAALLPKPTQSFLLPSLPCSCTINSLRSLHVLQHRTIAASSAGLSGRDAAASPAPQLIASTANDTVKHCVKLRENAKYRQQQRRVLVVGRITLQEIAGAPTSHLYALPIAQLLCAVHLHAFLV